MQAALTGHSFINWRKSIEAIRPELSALSEKFQTGTTFGLSFLMDIENNLKLSYWYSCKVKGLQGKNGS